MNVTDAGNAAAVYDRMVVEQTPLAQNWAAGQTCPHVPQLAESAARLLQTPAQTAEPVGQMQALPMHTLPVGHTCPQVPQLFESVVASVHRPPGHSNLGAQVMHAPARQN